MAYIGMVECLLKIISQATPIGNSICLVAFVPVIAFLCHNTKGKIINTLSKSQIDLYCIIEQYKCLVSLCKLNSLHLEEELSRHATIILKGFLYHHLANCLDPECPLYQYVYKNRSINSLLYKAKERASIIGSLNYFKLKKCLDIYKNRQSEIQLLMAENLMESSQKAVFALNALRCNSIKSGVIVTYQINRCMYSVYTDGNF
jgi:hypothetical protein